ncbi:uncharacterized protein [Hyperolius riggenbachi]|uniref:uncharacterized protein n=1 Tax=Hyperolius riggenbachi TaxID=752182 RepID=UPI0035A2F412
MDCERYKKHIQNFSFDKCALGNQGYKRLLLQVFGFTGHGKSSFINSCKYVMDDAAVYKNYAKVAAHSEKPETMIRKTHELTRNITLVDNRGCVRMDSHETGVIYTQLGHFLPLDTEVIWDSGFDATLKHWANFSQVDHSADFIVPVFAYSAEARMSTEDFENLKEIFTKAQEITGLIPTVVLTHGQSENLGDVWGKFNQLGATNMFFFENYTQQDQRKLRGKHERILSCLYEITEDVVFRMSEKRDIFAEQAKRSKVLFDFVREKEKKRAVEKALYSKGNF